MSGGAQSRFDRRTPLLKPIVVIVTEGKVTERQYFKMWAREYRTKITLVIPEHKNTDPVGLVNRAIEYKSDYANPKNEPLIWCVGDQDDHAYLTKAMQLAKANGIEYALSIPCLELWFILHFEEQTADISTKKVQSKCRGHLKDYEKSLTEKQLRELLAFYEKARTRAIALEKWHREKFTDEVLRNPSSNVWHLIDKLKALA